MGDDDENCIISDGNWGISEIILIEISCIKISYHMCMLNGA